LARDVRARYIVATEMQERVHGVIESMRSPGSNSAGSVSTGPSAVRAVPSAAFPTPLLLLLLALLLLP